MQYWDSYLYLYGIGGILFFSAIYLGIKKGVLKLERKQDKQLLVGFLIAYFLYAGVHLIWNFAAISKELSEVMP